MLWLRTRRTRWCLLVVAAAAGGCGNLTPIVFFDRDANLAWGLEFEGDHEIVERREDGITVLYTKPSSEETTLWRIDL